MSHFMLRWRFRESAAKALIEKPQDRTPQAQALVESFGGKLHGYYFTLGDHDGLAICEFPDPQAAAACSMTAAATGAFNHFETTQLLTAQEAATAMRKAHETKSTYRPPQG